MALMLAETGANVVAGVIRGSLLSAVNVSECCARGVERGARAEDVLAIIRSFDVEVIPFDLSSALAAARLREATKPGGAGIGDRAFLALGHERGLPAYTADRRLLAIDPALGIDLRLIR